MNFNSEHIIQQEKMDVYVVSPIKSSLFLHGIIKWDFYVSFLILYVNKYIK